MLRSITCVLFSSFLSISYAQYCASNATNIADEDIFNVTLGTLNNSSTCLTTGGAGSILNEYSNYTAVAAPNVTKCTSVAFSVQVGTCGGNYNNAVAIFVDWNADNDFADAGEGAYTSAASTNGAHTENGTISIPASATTGNKRMRVVCVETSTPSSITYCGTYSWGETEDYTINVLTGVCIGPGGVSNGLETWVKANNNVTGTTPITAWSNSAAGTGIAINGSPNLNNTATTYNYNPYVDFTAPAGVLADGLAANRQFLKLTSYSGTSGIDYKSLFWTFQLTDLTRVYTHVATVDNVTNSTPASGTFHGDADAGGTTASIMLEAYDITDFGTSAPAGTWQRNAVNIASNSNHSSNKHILSANCTTGGSTTLNTFLGGQRDALSPGFVGHVRDWKGPVAEVIGYTNSLTATERQQIHSYLAIKYGITLTSNYLNTTGATIFTTAAPYNNNIIGIGRDDAEALVQKQSHNDDDTVRIYISTLAASNAANGGSFSNDGAYVITGATTGKMCSTVSALAEMPAGCGLYSRLEREWKATKTSLAQTFNMDFKLAACGAPASVNVSHLRLLVDDDGNFANGGTTCYFNGDGTGIVFTYSNPVITVSNISGTHIPNNATRYITIASINALTPLPVGLLEFDAKLNQEQVVDLLWATESANPADYFMVEKSTDLDNWKTIVIVDGKTGSGQLTTYDSQDETPFYGNNYYRLKEVQQDNTFTYSDVRTVHIGSGEEILVYPNPASDNFTISGKHIANRKAVLFNTFGQEVPMTVSSVTDDNVTVETSELANGLYYLQVDGTVEIQTIKLIIKK